jgi:hypothetical protein
MQIELPVHHQEGLKDCKPTATQEWADNKCTVTNTNSVIPKLKALSHCQFQTEPAVN